jgi:hypothetical protein
MTLADIKAEAARLSYNRQPAPEEGGGGDGYDSLEEDLRILKRKHDRGAINAEEYSEAKQRLFEKLSGD